jgi:TP901 family phage tail tape measure protein
MSSEVFQLALLLTLKDAASGGLDRFQARLRAAGKDGEKFHSQFEKIRNDLNRDLAIGGVGLAGLALMGKGIKMAGNYQASMTDLRTTLAQTRRDGKIDLDLLGKDMLKAEAIAIDLGNRLPGTTEDFVQMVQVLRQTGLETKNIFDGTAEAVANLAVTSNAVPRDVAKNFGQFVQLFRLTGKESKSAADTMSRLYTSTGIGSDELIEGLKYFQGRSGAAIGLGGIKDAEKTVRLFGLLKKLGLEGTIAGTSLNNLFAGYTAAKNKKDSPLQMLKDMEGIDLKLYDAKGSFVGWDNLFKALEPLQKLSAEKQTDYLKQIFGEEGMSVATAMIKTGAAGWRDYNAAQEQTIPLTQKAEEVSKNFNNQLEALTGSAKNLVVTGLGPMLPSLTAGTQSLNKIVGSMTDFAKANPGMMQTLGTIALYGTTAMAAYGGIKTLTAGVRILRIVSQFSRGEGLVPFLSEVPAASQTATRNVAGFTSTVKTAGKEVSGLRGQVRTLASSAPVKLGVQIGAIIAAEAAIVSLLDYLGEVNARSAKAIEDAKTLRHEWDTGFGNLYKAPGKGGGTEDAVARAFMNSIDESGMLMRNLHIEKMGWMEMMLGGTPYGVTRGKKTFSGTESIQFNPETAARRWQGQGLGQVARDPNVLAAVLRQVQMTAGEKGMNLKDIELITAAIERLAERTYPENLKTAKEILAKQQPAAVTPGTGAVPMFGTPANPFPKFNELQLGLTNLQQPVGNTTKSFMDLLGPADKLPSSFQRIVISADSVSQGLQSAGSKLSSWQPPASSTPFGSPPIGIPSNAVGGIIERDGLAYVHAGNTITPARKRGFEGGGGVTINYAPKVMVNGGGKKAKAEFAAMLYAHKRDIEQIVAKQMGNGRERA